MTTQATRPRYLHPGWVLALALLAAPIPVSATVIVEFNPAASSVASGDTFGIDLFADIIGTSAVSFGLDVVFDAGLLNAVGATVNTAAFDAGATVDTLTDGVIGLTGFVSPFGTPVTGHVLLASLMFEAELTGTTLLDVSAVGPLQGFGEPFALGGAVVPIDTVNTGTVEITAAVPEPHTWWLIATGAVLMLSRFRKRKSVGMKA